MTSKDRYAYGASNTGVKLGQHGLLDLAFPSSPGHHQNVDRLAMLWSQIRSQLDPSPSSTFGDDLVCARLADDDFLIFIRSHVACEIS
jgi:hypothetical protein